MCHDMDSELRRHQKEGWERAYFQQKKEVENWKRQWQREREQREQAERRIQELERESEGLRQELVAARKTPHWVKKNKTEESKQNCKHRGPKWAMSPIQDAGQKRLIEL